MFLEMNNNRTHQNFRPRALHTN